MTKTIHVAVQVLDGGFLFEKMTDDGVVTRRVVSEADPARLLQLLLDALYLREEAMGWARYRDAQQATLEAKVAGPLGVN